MPVMKRMFLVFGSETKGLPPSIIDTYSSAVYYIPITRQIRSLNLSSAVGIVLFETLRHLLGPPEAVALNAFQHLLFIAAFFYRLSQGLFDMKWHMLILHGMN